MTMRKKMWAVLACCASIVAVVLLSAGLSDLELQPGHPLPRFQASHEGGEIPLPGFLDSEMARYVVVVVYFLAFLFLPLAIAYLIVSPEARRRTLRTLVLLLCLVALILTYPRRPEQQEQPQSQPAQGLSLDQGDVPVVEFVADPPQWAVVGTAAGLALLLAAGLVAVFWILWRNRVEESPLEQLAEKAEGAIEALHGGADLRDTVMRCYFEMEQVLHQKRGIRREGGVTPREFAHHLVEAGLPRQPVSRLTRLFEMVRYGAKALGDREEREALDSLATIVEVCRSTP